MSEPKPSFPAVGRLPLWLLPLGLGVLLMFAPFLGMDQSWTRQFMLIAIYTLVVSGVNLSFGYAGELALGQVAIYAAAAYTSGILAIRGWDLALELLAGVAVAAVLGFVSGLPGARLAGWGLAMSSFFLVIMIPDAVNLFREYTGGYSGLAGIPQATLFGATLESDGLYMVVIAVTILWLAVMRNIVKSRHGGALQVLRQSTVLASSLGINVYRTKMTAYVLGAVPAGLAGCLFAHVDLYLAPESFTFQLAIAFIAASVLGGSASIYGAFAGAFLLEIGPMQTAGFAQYALVAFGVFLVVGGVFLPGGVAGLARQALGVLRSRLTDPEPVRRTSAAEATIDPIQGKALEVTRLVKEFGGVRAVSEVTLVASPGQVTGLIGGNGSGKTTILNIVSGFYRADHGTVSLAGSVISGRAPHRVARHGVARTFQTPVIPRSLTTLEVLAAARYAGHYTGIVPTVLRLPRYRRQRTLDHEKSVNVLRTLGIEHLRHVTAESLPLGSRRMVEVARALVAEPAVLLLDEPASGLDEGEVEDLGRLVRRVADLGTTVLLVEHNFGLICAVSDVVHVLEFGRLIASGTPDQIQQDPAVVRSYLGEDAETVVAGPGPEPTDATTGDVVLELGGHHA